MTFSVASLFFLYGSAQRFFLAVFCFGIEHFVFSAAGTAAFLAPDFFLLLPSFAFDAENFFFKFVAQIAPGEKAVRRLQARLLAFYFDAGRRVTQLNARGGFVHFLPAGARRADKLLGQIGLTDLQLVHPRLQLFPFFLCDHGARKSRRGEKAQRKARQNFKFRLAKDF